MRDSTLATKAKNELFRLIEDKGLTPSLFSWRIEELGDAGYKYSQLYLTDTPDHRFNFLEGYIVEFRPSFIPDSIYNKDNKDKGAFKHCLNWDGMKSYFSEWLNLLKILLNKKPEQNLWEEYALKAQTYSSGTKIAPEESNEPFSYQDVKLIKETTEKVKSFISELPDVTEEQIVSSNEKLDYLVEQAKTQGKRNWFNIMVGVVTGIAVNLALNPKPVQTMFNFYKDALINVVYLLP